MFYVSSEQDELNRSTASFSQSTNRRGSMIFAPNELESSLHSADFNTSGFSYVSKDTDPNA